MKQWELRGVTVPQHEPLPTPAEPRDGSVPAAAEPLDGSVRALVDQLPALFWTTDSSLRFTSCLGAELGDVGLWPNQLVGTFLEELFDAGDSAPAAVIAHGEALRGRTVLFDLDWGRRRFRAHIGPLLDAEGDVIGTIGVALEADDPRGSVAPAGREGGLAAGEAWASAGLARR